MAAAALRKASQSGTSDEAASRFCRTHHTAWSCQCALAVSAMKREAAAGWSVPCSIARQHTPHFCWCSGPIWGNVWAMEAKAAPPLPADVVARFAAIVGAANCLSRPEELRTYECDGLTSFRARPGLVVLPQTTAEVSAVAKLAHELELPLVPRGSGTGLSGGALPVPGGVLVGLSRMKRILEIDFENAWI